ncbi:unnamed protein product [Brassica rapa subsp. trilocularis]
MGTYGYAAPEPKMSDVVEALKPLPHLKDMASSSYYFQTMQAERLKNGSGRQPQPVSDTVWSSWISGRKRVWIKKGSTTTCGSDTVKSSSDSFSKTYKEQLHSGPLRGQQTKSLNTRGF